MKVAFVLLGTLLLSVLIAEKSGKLIIFGYIYKVSLVVFFLISVYVNRVSFVNVRNKYLRYFLIILLCVFITLLFGYIALIIMINFDLEIGGHL